MSLNRVSRSLVLVAIGALSMIDAGCNGTDVQLKKEAPFQTPPSKPPEAQPKALRPRAGASSGMNYDPSGTAPR